MTYPFEPVLPTMTLDEFAIPRARVSEGHCAECCARLRTLTLVEQAKADGWWAEPFAVCTLCHAVHSRPRPGQPDYPSALTAVSWNTKDVSDPFRLGASS